MSEPFLRAVELRRERVPSFSEYPFCIPAVARLDRLELHPQVTFFIGENGTGKSTLLEALAVAEGFNPEGGSRNFHFSTRDSHSRLADYLVIHEGSRRLRDSDGFFLRAESLYNVASEIDRLADPEFLLKNYGGESLHEQSHGESFFSLLQHRFRGNGLYLLDEPEAALSPTRQMSFLTLMDDLIGTGSQFVIATHSPIIMAYPEATIYRFSEQGLRTVEYTETEHYKITKAFLTRHEQMLRELLRPR